MTTWEKSSSGLIGLFEELAPPDPAVVKKQMFGWPCCFVNGNLFLGLHKQSIVFRLSDADRAEFLKLEGTGDFEPVPGGKMAGYAILHHPLSRDRGVLRRWVRRSLVFASALPAKANKKAVRKASA